VLAIAIYRLLTLLASPLIVVYFLLRGLKDRRYFGTLGQRLGFLPGSYRQTGQTAIWLHAVSVGEVLASAALVRALRARFPLAPLFVSASTLAGKAAAESHLAGVADGVFYAPIDYCFAVRRVLRTLRPRVVVVLETEIWPNLYREVRRAGCGLIVVNGRISDRALPRYTRLRWFFRHVLAWPDMILAQSYADRDRYLALGAKRAQMGGNLKYDFEPPTDVPAAVAGFLQVRQPAEVWIAASTMAPAAPGDPDEDEAVIAAFRELSAARPRLVLLLVPRKPERFDTAAAALARAGVPFVRRSGGPADHGARVLRVDSIGELGALFPLADVVFMGGTLARRGGHNILEPALAWRPVIAGPHMENFAEIADRFTAARALVRIGEAAELAPAVRALLENPKRRAEIGARAKDAADSERGATARAASEIARLYEASLPRFRPPLAAALWPLARLWLAGNAVNRWRGTRLRRRLTTPVISVGGLTVGGVGKSPLVLWLAERLKERGHQPAILTRGYRRRVAEECTLVGPGEHAPVARTGDEAQMYVRAGIVPLGIAADRAEAGKRVEALWKPGVFLLDDGFQHWRLARSLDIVVLDALDPFGGGAAVPLGRLREPVTALARAGAVVVARTAPGESIAAIEAVVRRYNKTAQVFVSRVVPRGWRDTATGEPAAPEPPYAAFCGLGNPGSFWRTLRGMDIRPTVEYAFPDHHRYTREELAGLGAPTLLTTEKDAANLPADLPCRVLWLEIGIEVENADELLSLAEASVSASAARP
jgi:3-deoxy-D-manno-octulosonic-acid transferase